MNGCCVLMFDEQNNSTENPYRSPEFEPCELDDGSTAAVQIDRRDVIASTIAILVGVMFLGWTIVGL